MFVFYAKSTGETVEEHTNKVLKAFEKIKSYLNINEKESFIIQKLIEFHDAGKKNPAFQKKIRNVLKNPKKFNWNDDEVPHEWLSPGFVSLQEEELIKKILKELNLDEEKFFDFFLFVILSHHHRNGDKLIYVNDLIKKNFDWIRKNWGFEVEYHYRVEDLLRKYNKAENKEMWDYFFPYRVKWLGVLMKCDYCASAGIKPEVIYQGNYQNDFKQFLHKKQMQLREFQRIAGKNADKNIILIASTGMGKTEAAMNWINGQKAFYLLGIRTAVNAMYERFRSIFKDNVSLLHGEVAYFLAETETEEDEYEEKIERARKLSYPLTVATADQLITSVFKYPGFELPYLTCSYSKIVLDEIQSFSPGSIAAIVVFLKEIYKLGGKFMLMTATLPSFLLEELKDVDNLYVFEPQLLKIKRHKILVIDEDIESEITKKIIRKNQDKKILIICNTVRKAQQMYKFLKEFSPNLIHALFTLRDRKQKENEIMQVVGSCVWISTQVVEASLDIDFDILLTENASIESLFQRFGRCYRKREYKIDEPNIYIFASKSFNIYDKDLFKATWNILKAYNDKFISEEDKQSMIAEVFKNVEKTNYFNNYKKVKDLLEIGYRSMSKVEAQEDFRQIFNNYLVIPEIFFKKELQKIDNLLRFIEDKRNSKFERIKKQAELFNYTIPFPVYEKKITKLRNIEGSKFCKRKRIMILRDYSYSFECGLESLEDTEDVFDNII